MKKIIAALTVLVGSGLAWAGCSQNTPVVTVRSLERSGKAAFLCIRYPRELHPKTNPPPKPGIQMDGCFVPDSPPPQYYYLVPHVIALVTQMARGELAVVDVTAGTVVDVDKSTPGYNFLPIGASPTDVVATQGSNASFVGIGDPTRPAIFGIPSTKLPLWVESAAVDYASWPACALPPGGVPTEMLVVPDMTPSSSDPGGRRAFCDGTPGTIPSEEVDLTLETEMFGRQKLAVLMPELGEIDIIDAQELLARPPGEFEPCKIERRVLLSGDPGMPPPPPPSQP
ncbi:MAG: LEPR-XLL domain-containing protein, partial [Polyangiaceae bacterium]